MIVYVYLGAALITPFLPSTPPGDLHRHLTVHNTYEPPQPSRLQNILAGHSQFCAQHQIYDHPPTHLFFF